MKIFHDPRCLLHDTVELLGARLQRALECPERLVAILAALEGTHHCVELHEADEASSAKLDEVLARTHDAGYIRHLKSAHALWVRNGLIEEKESILPECFPMPATSVGAKVNLPPKDVFAQPGFYAFDTSTGLTKDSWRAIHASAGIAAVVAREIASYLPGQREKSKHCLSAMALCRPPGHHCTTAKAGGYCYINNAVVAVDVLREERRLRSLQPPKVAILDLDVHHGNGTQDAFYTDPSVLYVSIHAKDEYPYYSGSADEQGAHGGAGCNLNLPLEVGSSLEMYLELLDIAIDKIGAFEADYLILSLGFDTYMLDPLGKFQIDTQDYETIARKIQSNGKLTKIPTAILLEGGYVVDRLGPNLLSFLEGWTGGEDTPV